MSWPWGDSADRRTRRRAAGSSRRPFSTTVYRSEWADVLRLFTLAARSHVELDLLPFTQGLVAAPLNVRVVDEHVVPILSRDEAVALLGVEKLHCSSSQRISRSRLN